MFPLHGFSLYDSRAVMIGTRVATAFLTDSADVAEHEKLFGELEALADWGGAAREHLGSHSGRLSLPALTDTTTPRAGLLLGSSDTPLSTVS